MFTHLHTHTHFSFGLGASSPEVLAQAAAERGFNALACTDTNGVYGAVEFQRACDAAGVRPILGAHLVADGQEVVALARMSEAGERSAGQLRQSTGGREQRCPAAPLPSLAHRDRRDGLILLSRDVGFLEQTLHLSGPAESLRRASARQAAPRDTGRRAPAGTALRRHQRSGRRATRRIGAGTGCSAPSR